MKILRIKNFTSIKDIKKVLKTPMKDLENKFIAKGGKKLKNLRKAMNADFTEDVRNSLIRAGEKLNKMR